VQTICKEHPEFVTHLARLASIGLLTEVVEDFIKPVQAEQRADLTIVVDAPLALDYLGCSGTALKEDVKSIFDSLRGIGCNFVVFPTTCDEMRRNLDSMLSRPPNKRHGYTHEAMARGEVLQDYVVAVAHNPQEALEKVGVQVRPLSLEQFPNTHAYFTDEQYRDFLEAVYWVEDWAPRDHDATCLALLMRLRQGKHNSDLFKCGYVFATRNATFVKESRQYCLNSRLIKSVQQGPIIHQRQLATIAWLRTGLGAAEQIPRRHLLATCDRVLRVRMEVSDAVEAKLKQVTPEKIEQFQLLLQDHRSVRRLADETLNDERVVTTENAGLLLEAMRQAAVEEERKQFEAKYRDQQARHRKAQRVVREDAESARAERDALRVRLAERQAADEARVDLYVRNVSWCTKRVEIAVTALLLIFGVAGILNYFTGVFKEAHLWAVVSTVALGFGLYELLMTILERHKYGLGTLLDLLAKWFLRRRLASANLSSRYTLEDFDFKRGQISRKGPKLTEFDPPADGLI